jgi:uracil-DNA glycosylase
MKVSIDSSWEHVLKAEFNKDYFKQIALHIKTEIQAGHTIYPPGKFIFNAFNTTTFNNVKVVILGQDPYHNPGQAHGLSFSVADGVYPPPSLNNIFKELATDIGMPIPSHGNLTKWAKQGVLLLNASLTVRKNEPMSHSKIGWAQFTDSVIKTISDQKTNVAFVLWGKFAQEKAGLIDAAKHLVLSSAHPSPMSAERGFFGCQHFSKINNYLIKHQIPAIDWYL